jgi:hypothetical protein
MRFRQAGETIVCAQYKPLRPNIVIASISRLVRAQRGLVAGCTRSCKVRLERSPLKLVNPSPARQRFIDEITHSPGERKPSPLIEIRPSLFTLRLLSREFGRPQADIPIPGNVPVRSAPAHGFFNKLVHTWKRMI